MPVSSGSHSGANGNRSSQGEDRASILRGVYEENKDIDKFPDGRKKEKEQVDGGRSWTGPLIGVLVGVLVLVAGLNYHFGEGWSTSGWAAQPAAMVTDGDTEATAGLDGASLESMAGDAGEALPFDAPRETAPQVDRTQPVGSALAGLSGSGDLDVARIFGLHVRTIVIDPGHGGEEEGAIGPNGLMEKNVALDIAHRLRQRLQQHGNYRILMTREGDEHIPLRDRVEFANDNDADLFISLHLNSLPNDQVSSIETYYFGTEASERGLRMAERENRHADYSVSEFNEMISSVGETMRLQESKRLATSIQTTLFRNMSMEIENVRDWGVRTAPFVVLLGVEAPSVLAEMAVLSNHEEEEKLRTREHREHLASSLEEGIIEYLDDSRPTTATR